jgi:hypothetical protein
MGSELMLTGAPSKRHYEKFNGLVCAQFLYIRVIMDRVLSFMLNRC